LIRLDANAKQIREKQNADADEQAPAFCWGENRFV
jgi:hypothetical protein